MKKYTNRAKLIVDEDWVLFITCYLFIRFYINYIFISKFFWWN
jgi:hypothetical protein